MLSVLCWSLAWGAPIDRSAVDEVLDALHRAATEADAGAYFGLFTEDAVFVGTDASEVWDLDAFRAYAAPAFEEAPAWAYTPVTRDVRLGPRGRTAWFYETLTHARYGDVRGSGALVRDGGDWRIAQYVLSFSIPNEVGTQVVDLVQGRVRTSTKLPPPFTAAEIRRGCAPGRTITTRTRQGDTVTTNRTTFLAHDVAHEARFRVESYDADGNLLSAREAEAPWDALRDHAAFPSRATSWTEERITTEAGTFDTRRYVVTEGTTERSYWFSLAHPGPPFRTTVVEEGQQKLVSEVVANRGPR